MKIKALFLIATVQLLLSFNVIGKNFPASAKAINSHTPVKLFQMAQHDFDVDEKILSKGHIQYAEVGMKPKKIKKESSFYNTLSRLNGYTKNKKGNEISFYKIAFLLPRTSSKEQTNKLTCQKEFVKNNYRNTTFVHPTYENLLDKFGFDARSELQKQNKLFAIEKNLPLGKKLQVVFKAYDVDPRKGMSQNKMIPDRILASDLIFSNRSEVTYSYAHTEYYDLADKSGTLVVIYRVSKLNIGSGLFAKIVKKIIKKFRKKEFEKEIIHLVKNTRSFFESNRQSF